MRVGVAVHLRGTAPWQVRVLLCRARALCGIGFFAEWSIAAPGTGSRGPLPSSLEQLQPLPHLRNSDAARSFFFCAPGTRTHRGVFFFEYFSGTPKKVSGRQYPVRLFNLSTNHDVSKKKKKTQKSTLRCTSRFSILKNTLRCFLLLLLTRPLPPRVLDTNMMFERKLFIVACRSAVQTSRTILQAHRGQRYSGDTTKTHRAQPFFRDTNQSAHRCPLHHPRKCVWGVLATSQKIEKPG